MRFVFQQPPVAGGSFRMAVVEFAGPVQVIISINDRPLARRACPVPPCYDVIQIPDNAGGHVLRIVGQDIMGQESLDLPIRPIGGSTERFR